VKEPRSQSLPRGISCARRTPLAVFAFLALAFATVSPSVAQFDIFADSFESGTCLGWHVAFPFCITPTVGLRIEVTWETPGDPVPDDDVGSDFDLHVLHPLAAGDWESAFDCYSGNPTPDWGIEGQPQDAALIFEDADGLGPEAVQLTLPENLDYGVGVFYADDAGFGESFVTARVFVDGVPVYEYLDKLLFAGEFWEFGLVTWPGAGITEIDIVHVGIP
jgi:hypothetical protein